MQIAVLDYSTKQVFIYNFQTEGIDALTHGLEVNGYHEDWASKDDNDIVEMWLAHVKHHDLDCIHYMTADEIDYNITF